LIVIGDKDKTTKLGTLDHTIIQAINIESKYKPSPTPVPTPSKDETCEKVIGPTWHWNNKKGICEDTGVVRTYTR